MSAPLTPAAIAALAKAKKPAFHVPWHPELMQYAADFQTAAAGTVSVDPCMLAAIVERESGGQNILQIGVAPGPGCGVGLCQITSGVDWSDLSTPVYPGYGLLLDPLVNLQVAAHAFLDPLLAEFPGDHIAAFAAYNLGPTGVKNEIAQGRSPDAQTTGGNYGTSVFTSWINFVAASLGVSVEWSGGGSAKLPSQQVSPNAPGHEPSSPPRLDPSNPQSDISNN